MHIPDHITFEEAVSSCGSGILTTGLALYQFLELQLPEAPSAKPVRTILIYGASTAVGSMAVQFAKLFVNWNGWAEIVVLKERAGPAGRPSRLAARSTLQWPRSAGLTLSMTTYVRALISAASMRHC